MLSPSKAGWISGCGIAPKGTCEDTGSLLDQVTGTGSDETGASLPVTTNTTPTRGWRVKFANGALTWPFSLYTLCLQFRSPYGARSSQAFLGYTGVNQWAPAGHPYTFGSPDTSPSIRSDDGRPGSSQLGA